MTRPRTPAAGCTDGSRLYQRTCLTVAPDATVIFGEILLPGRMARNESHVYDVYWSDTEVRDLDRCVWYVDTLRLRPGEIDDPTSAGVLGGYDVLASLQVICSGTPSSEMVALLRDALADVPEILAGVTELPGGRGAAVRILGRTSRAVQAAVRAAWDRARIELLGAPAPDLRKG